MKLSHLVGMLVVGGLAVGVQVGAAQYGGSDTAKKPAAKPAAAKAGGAHSMTGCLAKGTEPNTWMLTNIEGKGPKEAELVEVPATLNLAPHVGHKVTITGTAVSAKAAARTETGAKKPAKGEMKEEGGEHDMKPSALKMVSASCP